MKFIFLTKGNSEIAVNRDAIAYVSKSEEGAHVYLTSTNEDGKLIHFHVKESFDDVMAMLNAEIWHFT